VLGKAGYYSQAQGFARKARKTEGGMEGAKWDGVDPEGPRRGE